jgi:hypothetical protein
MINPDMKVVDVVEQRDLILALTNFRKEWENVVDDRSLVAVETNVGLLLSDITEVLGLTDEERIIVLGHALTHDLSVFCATPIF